MCDSSVIVCCACFRLSSVFPRDMYIAEENTTLSQYATLTGVSCVCVCVGGGGGGEGGIVYACVEGGGR